MSKGKKLSSNRTVKLKELNFYLEQTKPAKRVKLMMPRAQTASREEFFFCFFGLFSIKTDKFIWKKKKLVCRRLFSSFFSSLVKF